MQISAVAGVIYERQTCPYAIGSKRRTFHQRVRRRSRDEQIRSLRNIYNGSSILYDRAFVSGSYMIPFMKRVFSNT